VTDVFENVSDWLTVPDVAELLDVPIGRVRKQTPMAAMVAGKKSEIRRLAQALAL